MRRICLLVVVTLFCLSFRAWADETLPNTPKKPEARAKSPGEILLDQAPARHPRQKEKLEKLHTELKEITLLIASYYAIGDAKMRTYKDLRRKSVSGMTVKELAEHQSRVAAAKGPADRAMLKYSKEFSKFKQMAYRLADIVTILESDAFLMRLMGMKQKGREAAAKLLKAGVKLAEVKLAKAAEEFRKGTSSRRCLDLFYALTWSKVTKMNLIRAKQFPPQSKPAPKKPMHGPPTKPEDLTKPM